MFDWKQGRKRKTTDADDAVIVEAGKRLFRKSIPKVTTELNSPDAATPLSTTVSKMTVRRRFKEAGARSVKPVKDDLTKAHKEFRYLWACCKTPDVERFPTLFDVVLFSHEVRFCLSLAGKKVRI